MGFRIPEHLRNSLYRRFNRTEFDNVLFDPNKFSLLLNSWDPCVGVAESGLLTRARQQPLIKGIDMFDRNSFDLRKTETVFKSFDCNLCCDLIKKIAVDKHTFEMIAVHDLRVVYINTNEEFDLNNESTVIITCGDAALIAHVAGLCKSKVDTNLSLLEFELADRPLP